MHSHPPRFGQIHIPHWFLHALHLLATALGLVVAITLWLDQEYGIFQHSPGGDAFEVNEQPFFLIAFAIGALLALRYQLLGGTIATFTAAALIVFANRQLRVYDAVLVSLGFLIPGLLWLIVGLFDLRDEKFHRSPDEHPRPLLRRRDVLGGLIVIAAAATGGVRIGRYLFDRLYGPTHPASTAAALPKSATRWLWSGAVTPTSAAFTTRLQDDDAADVRLLITTGDTFDDARSVSGRSNDEGLVRVDVDGLEPDTRYHYGWVVDDMLDDTRTGMVRTAPVGPASFSLVVGGCARTGSNGAVFDTIRTLDPAMVVMNGDFHYADITRNDQQAFRQILDHTLARPGQAALFRDCPVAYVWDDHDFGGANSDSDSRPAASASYRLYCPHYPLASETSTLHQAFSIGRVRVLITDARSGRVPGDVEDDDDDDDGEAGAAESTAAGDGEAGLTPTADGTDVDGDFEDEMEGPGTMLGAEQKQWLKDELLAARDTHALTIWVNPVPWISAPNEEGEADDWSGFVTERSELADFIADNALAASLMMAAGDAHMVAIDDGTNSDYSAGGGAGFPILHCAALDRPGSLKGGPYSHGAFPGGGQFGLITVTDDGGDVSVDLSGRNWRNEDLVTYSFTVPA